MGGSTNYLNDFIQEKDEEESPVKPKVEKNKEATEDATPKNQTGKKVTIFNVCQVITRMRIKNK